MRRLGQAALGDKDETCSAAEPRAAAVRTGAHAEVLRQFLAYRQRFRLAISPLEVGQDALERMSLARSLPLAFGVAEFDRLITAAIQQHLLHLRRQLGPGCFDIKRVVPRERLDELEVVRIAAIPAAHGAARE